MMFRELTAIFLWALSETYCRSFPTLCFSINASNT